MHTARLPSTSVEAQARYALSTPPLKATMTDWRPSRRSKRRACLASGPSAPGLLVVILLLLLFIFVEVVEIVVVASEVLFVFVLVLVVIQIVVVVREVELVGTGHDEVLATFRTTEGVAVLVVLGVNLVELALGAGRHTGSKQQGCVERRK